MNADEKQEELNRQDAKGAKNSERHWWVKMVVASATLAALLLALFLLAPAGQRYYHTLVFRTGMDKDGTHVVWLAKHLLARKASRSEALDLLGSASGERPDALFYVTNSGDGMARGCMLIIQDDRVAEVQPTAIQIHLTKRK